MYDINFTLLGQQFIDRGFKSSEEQLKTTEKFSSTYHTVI